MVTRMSDEDVLAGAERTINGRYVIYSNDGRRYERGADQAREMLGSGEFRPSKYVLESESPLARHTADTYDQPLAAAASVVSPAVQSRRKKD